MEASDRDIQEVERLVRSFAEAISRADAAPLDHLLANDFVGTNRLARVLDKKQTMAELASSDYEFDSLVNEDIRVHSSGISCHAVGNSFFGVATQEVSPHYFRR